jgi:polyisoprenoid-binding protein YceI
MAMAGNGPRVTPLSKGQGRTCTSGGGAPARPAAQWLASDTQWKDPAMMSRRHSVITTLLLPLALACTQASAQQAPPLEAPSGTYVLEKSHASMTWRIRHMGLSNYTARFKRFDATIQLDAKDMAKSSVRASVDVGSIETDFTPIDGSDFNAELKSEPFFNIGKFPQATFVSSKVTPNGPRSMKVDGTLTLLGISKPLSLAVTLNGSMKSHPFAKVPALGVSVTTQVPRLSFGLNPPPIQQGVGEIVDIAIEAEFLQQP